MRISALLLAVFSITLFAGCRTVAVIPVGSHVRVSHTLHVIPPHAPAHGYRHHHHDNDLEYDSDFGAYVVLGYDGVYFYNNLYLRFYSGGWQTTSRLGSTWHHAEHQHVPDRLRGHRRFRHSPPSHAPAHGHRHHHHNVDMVFDSRIGAYIVLGFDNLFFFNNHYMRFYDGYWHTSDRHNGQWHRSKDRHVVPHKLKKARNHNKKSFFRKLKKQYRKEHHEHRARHDNRGKNRNHNKRKNNQKEEGRKRKHDKDEDRDNNHKREKRGSGWLR